MRKKLILVVFTMIFSLLTATTAFANLSTNLSTTETKAKIQPTIVGDCPLYGVHQSHSTGRTCTVYVDGVKQGTIFSEYRCQCGSTIIFDGHPEAHPAGAVGHYATSYTYGYIGGFAVAQVTSSNYHYTSNTYLTQWEFIAG